jgi:hypothetical protein
VLIKDSVLMWKIESLPTPEKPGQALQRRDLRQDLKTLQLLLNNEVLVFLLIKEKMLMWKIKWLDMVCSTASSPLGE